MNIFGLTLTRSRAVEKSTMTPITSTNSFWGYVRESFAGAWQGNVTVSRDEVAAFFAVYACVSLIAQDISKMRLKLVEQQSSGVWKEIRVASHTPVLVKPNHYQTRIKFFESWVLSKLLNGNAYILKQRDNRNVVTALYVLDPFRVTALTTETGDVYYQLKVDYLSGQPHEVVVPASEIIHDTCVTLFHPLLGVTPLFACGLAATQGIKIQTNSTKLFTNMSRPAGILTAPGAIADETAARLKAEWDSNYTGDNMGKTAVLGDGLHYEAMTINPADAQLIEQLKMTGEVCCSVFHVPPYMVGIGAMPTYNNIEALNQQYYTQALQAYIEQIELLMDEGLGLSASGRGTEFDLDGLLRMDTATRFKSHSDGIGGGWLAPNEVRYKENLEPVKGGDSPYLQQQNYSLEALAERDADKPFSKPAPQQVQPAQEADEEADPIPEGKLLELLFKKGCPDFAAFEEAA